MTIRVLLFAEARLRIGADSVAIELAPGSSVNELRREIGNRFPELQPLLSRSVFALNQRFALDSDLVNAQDEVAWIPPVSGG